MSEIESIKAYDRDAGRYREVKYNGSNVPSGEAFRYTHGEGYLVYAKGDKAVKLIHWHDCPAADLKEGLNAVGLSCAPQGLKAYQILQGIGDETIVSSVQRFNTETGRFETLSFESGETVGEDFPIASGEGALIYMKQRISGYNP